MLMNVIKIVLAALGSQVMRNVGRATATSRYREGTRIYNISSSLLFVTIACLACSLAISALKASVLGPGCLACPGSNVLRMSVSSGPVPLALLLVFLPTFSVGSKLIMRSHARQPCPPPRVQQFVETTCATTQHARRLRQWLRRGPGATLAATRAAPSATRASAQLQ